MHSRIPKASGVVAIWVGLLTALPASADPFFFSTGTVNNLIATASRPGPASGANQETESADDFFLPSSTNLTSATFTGLIPNGASASQVVVEIYRVFPAQSDTTRTSPIAPFPTDRVPARQNSPADVEFADRDSAVAGELTFTTSPVGIFTSAQNSVDTGIHPIPNFNTHGDGQVSGLQEVQFNVTFTEPIDLPPDHYFFVPQVLLSNPDQHFLWLSASRPIDSTTPFPPGITDLQSWIRNAQLDPDWLRIGTDIVGGTTFNAAFTVTGVEVPEPASLTLFGAALAGMGLSGWRRRRRRS